MHRIISRTIAIVSTLLACSIAQAVDFGRTPGSFGVSAVGSATYSVPVWIPQGTGGIQPEISLGYDSQAGNSIAGVGWNLAAVTSIERCAKTSAQDGTDGAINLYDDRYCLGGNRLRFISGSFYGAPNSTYATELAEYSRITAYNTATNGPQYFIVEGKDGLRYEYGNTVDSRVVPSNVNGSTSVLRWMLNKVSDRDGNRYVVSYLNETGFAVPDTISWNWDGATYRNTAKFNYFLSRTIKDSYTGRLVGAELSNRKRLENIQLFNGSVLVRKYVLGYETSGVTQLSRLRTVKECSDDAALNCLLPITFTYQDGQAGVTAGNAAAPSGSSNSIVKGRYDFNGDGKDDIAYKSGTAWFVALSTNTGFSAAYNTGITGSSTTLLIEKFLPNGRDAIAVPGNPLRIVRWDDGTGAFTSISTGVNDSISAYAADYDGDGLADLIAMQTYSLLLRRNTSTSASPNPQFSSSTIVTGQLTPGPNGPRWSRIYTRFPTGLPRTDLNGDGRQDIYGVGQIKVQSFPEIWSDVFSIVMLGDANGFTAAPSGTWSSGVEPGPMNLNGDACTDRWNGPYGNVTSIQIAQCDGSSAFAISAPAAPVLVLDWDGDGKTDILVNNGGNFGVYLSTGTGFSSLITTSIPSSGTFFAADLDGDGLDDLVKVNGTSAVNYWTHTANGSIPTNFGTNIPDLLVSVADGYGITSSIGYSSTSWGTVYDKGTLSTYPLQEADPAIVVAQVTTSDGVSTNYTKSYYYTGARKDAVRGGLAGFQRVDDVDSRNQIKRRVSRELLFPTAGMVTQVETLQPNGTTAISRRVLTNLFATLDPANFNQRYFPYLSTATTTEYEAGGTYNGSLLRTATTTNLYDTNSGSAYDITTVVTEPAGANGVNGGATWNSRTYTPLANIHNDTPNWCIGRFNKVRAISSNSLGFGTEVTRTTDLTWDLVKCRPTIVIAEQGDAQLAVTTELGYDGFGNLSSVATTGVGMDQRLITSVFSDATHPTGQFPLEVTRKVSSSFSQTSRMSWNYDLGVPASSTDPNGIVTSWQYDPFGRRIREDHADTTYNTWIYGDCATYGVCADGKMFVVERLKDSGGATITGNQYALDSYDRKTWQLPQVFGTSDNVSISLRWKYDALGRLYQASIPRMSKSTALPTWVTYTYDLLDRPIQISRPVSELDSSPQSSTRTYEGMKTTTTDAKGSRTYVFANAIGQVARVQDEANYFIDYLYDAFGGLKRARDMNGSDLQTVSYNTRGAMTGSTDLSRGSWGYSPNALGEVTSYTDAKGQLTSFQYDLLGRVKKRIEPEGENEFIYGTSFADKNIGVVRTLTGPGSYAENYTFDSVGRLSQKRITADSTDYLFDYTYNSRGQLSTIEYPVSTNNCRFKIQYGYWFPYVNSLTNVSNAANCGSTGEVLWTANEGNAFDALISESFGNGMITAHGYDAVTGMLKSVQTGTGASTNNLQNLSYEWDKVGNLTRRAAGSPANLSETFIYDSRHRLDYSQLNGSTNLDVNYDDLGNITYKSDVGNYTYHTTKKHQVVSTSNGWSFGYDNNGNMNSGLGTGNTWASFNLPTSITSGSNSSAFAYTPAHAYWKQTANYSGVPATTLYLDGLLEKVTAGSATDFRHQVSVGSARIIVSRSTSGTNNIYFVTRDHLGGSSVVANASGAPMIDMSFGAYGARRGSNWSGGPSGGDQTVIANVTRRGFTDHTMLDNLNLIHMNGRVYDQLLGRFVSADPYISNPGDTQNYNRYSYVSNRPLSNTDPSGFDTYCIKAGVFSHEPGVGRYDWDLDRWTSFQLGWDCSVYFPDYPATYASYIGIYRMPGSMVGEPGSMGWKCVNPAMAYRPVRATGIACNGCLEKTFWNKNPLRHFVGTIIGDMAAPFTEYDQNPLTGEFLTPREIQDAKFLNVVNVATLGGSMELNTLSRAANFTKAHPFAPMLEGRVAPQGFSAVVNEKSGEIAMRASQAVPKGTPAPAGMVAREGGHAAVSESLGSNTAEHMGFAVVMQQDGSLAVTWTSRTLNPGPTFQVPEALRPGIVEAVEQLTGRKVTSF